MAKTYIIFEHHPLLCILTSKRVLRMTFAGRNQFFDAKTTFMSFSIIKCVKKFKNNKNTCIVFFACFMRLSFLFFCSVSNWKSCFSVKNLILTSKQHAEHPLACQNTQQPSFHFICKNLIGKKVNANKQTNINCLTIKILLFANIW